MILLRILKYVWQLPQFLLGIFIVSKLQFIHVLQYNEILVFIVKENICICLGPIIIITEHGYNNKIEKHEKDGHGKQSLILGPFYLLLVLCSIIRYQYDAIFHKNWKQIFRLRWYYSGWCEYWADSLAGIRRRHLTN